MITLLIKEAYNKSTKVLKDINIPRKDSRWYSVPSKFRRDSTEANTLKEYSPRYIVEGSCI